MNQTNMLDSPIIEEEFNTLDSTETVGFDYATSQPLTNQFHYPSITDPLLHAFNQSFMVDIVEIPSYISIQHDCVHGIVGFPYLFQYIMGTPTKSGRFFPFYEYLYRKECPLFGPFMSLICSIW